MNREQAAVAAHDAAELLVTAGLLGSKTLEAKAHALLAEAAAGDGNAPTAEDRAAFIEVDPVSAATLGWLSYPDLQAMVAPDPDRYLYPDEAAAVRARAADLRLVVLARTLGKTFLEVRADRQPDFDLAARGNPEDARRVWQMFRAEGLVDGEPPTNGRP